MTGALYKQTNKQTLIITLNGNKQLLQYVTFLQYPYLFLFENVKLIDENLIFNVCFKMQDD